MKREELEAVIEYLVKRVKELKSDTRKLNNKLDDAFQMISKLAEAKKQILERQDKIEEKVELLRREVEAMSTTDARVDASFKKLAELEARITNLEDRGK